MQGRENPYGNREKRKPARVFSVFSVFSAVGKGKKRGRTLTACCDGKDIVSEDVDVVLHLKFLPDPDGVPEGRRLAQGLRFLLRYCGLRNVRIEWRERPVAAEANAETPGFA
jgi:hypothetical protein